MKRISKWNDSAALKQACSVLEKKGYVVVPAGADTDILLLPIPTNLAAEELSFIRAQVGEDTRIVGGGAGDVDLLQDAGFLAKNAAITAHCALQVTLENTDITMDKSKVLILGWGRIGKCLSQLLKALGAEVTVYARKASDRAMAQALGYKVTAAPAANADVVYNTIPDDIGADAGSALGIELASGQFLRGEHIISARGLPGRLAPGSTGRLIAESVDILAAGKERVK